MRKLSYIFILVLFIFAGYFSWKLYFKVYRQDDTVSIHSFPTTVGEWTSEELPLSATEKAILETDNAFVRRYTNSTGDEVMLFIVYSQNNRKVSHPPEICYTGAGAAILNNAHDSFEVQTDDGLLEIAGNRLTVEFGRYDQTVFYWFKVGDTFTGNYWEQQGLIALKSFLGKPSSSAMIRLSADVKNDDSKGTMAAIKTFGQAITPILPHHLP